MKTLTLTLLFNLIVTIGLLSIYKERVVAPMIDYQDIYANSTSGWVCVTHEPSDAHPEMYWSWDKLSYGTRVVCHGEYVPPPEISNQD